MNKNPKIGQNLKKFSKSKMDQNPKKKINNGPKIKIKFKKYKIG